VWLTPAKFTTVGNWLTLTWGQGHFILTFRYLVMPFYWCPAKYCGNVGLLKTWCVQTICTLRNLILVKHFAVSTLTAVVSIWKVIQHVKISLYQQSSKRHYGKFGWARPNKWQPCKNMQVKY